MRITRRAELERTPLSDIFRGQLRSSLCRENEEVSDNIQPFFTLQLDIEVIKIFKQLFLNSIFKIIANNIDTILLALKNLTKFKTLIISCKYSPVPDHICLPSPNFINKFSLTNRNSLRESNF